MEELLEKCVQRPESLLSDRVVDPCAPSLTLQQTRPPQHPQMMRNGWLRQIEAGFDVAHAYLTGLPRQDLQDPYPHRMADRLVRRRQRRRAAPVGGFCLQTCAAGRCGRQFIRLSV